LTIIVQIFKNLFMSKGEVCPFFDVNFDNNLIKFGILKWITFISICGSFQCWIQISFLLERALIEHALFVCGVGTGGTITGIAEYLKSKNPSIKVVAVEPENCALLSGGEPGIHKIQGLTAGFIASVTNVNLIDEIVTIKEEEAFKTSRRLAREEGLFVGMSSGAAAWGAILLSQKVENKNKNIVTC
jgi:hypothetical protein